ncbi:chemotaxis protein CheY [Rhizobium leguminosarum bv. trifolii CB782]|uniref:Response regulator n=1 Tax=Rhizobium hidalgonense TaxID=1538159 RepID=A0A2A6KC00_9HYPH|nr:response regulator [Rhizobium hidalgonense]AHG45200.1 chemotaxis protein CheY [Rhizobium leguminosarum bv. trifolii CB782]MDR9774514.1 response regulator [Rhizobium hidalgonense]MDR9805257.1 response regulator [Rhizobium hidalgonense]MDR9809498.1 response regulator [Rhizobium hidalgonense]MDR9821008.1 response regulator [Rhizobium hidalgonense]
MDDPAEIDVEGRRSVLVVEDELLIAMELKEALIAGGFRVLGPAASVDHALDLVSEECPHAAVLDFNLVGEKVTPVALQLKALGVPFVLASAVHPAELAVHPVLAGVANIGKPTDLKRLVDVLKTFLT